MEYWPGRLGYLIVLEEEGDSFALMNNIMKWMLVAVAPVLLVASAMGQEKAAPKVEKAEEAKTPMVTFYYFDG